MAITNQSVLNKMIDELQKAAVKKDQTDVVREHVRAVRLLCDLLLDSDVKTDVNEIDQDIELKKMIGNYDPSLPRSVPNLNKGTNAKPSIDHEEANGDSIFDF